MEIIFDDILNIDVDVIVKLQMELDLWVDFWENILNLVD